MLPVFTRRTRFNLGPSLGAAVLWLVASYAWSAERFIEGEHYHKLPISVSTLNAELPEVVELFSYLCIHCYNFDPMLEQWVADQGDTVAFRRVPAVFSETWALLAQAFYAADALDVSDQMHGPLFEAIHQKQLNLGDPSIMAELFQREADVNPERFMDVFTSFGVRSKVQWADGQTRAYRIPGRESGVPSLVVEGKYLVDGTAAGNNDNMLRVVEFLLNKERAAADTAKPSVAGTTSVRSKNTAENDTRGN